MKITKNKKITHSTANEAESIKFGKMLGAKLKKGDLITLDGDLGTGKTLLTGAIAQSVGIDRSCVSSPTYTIMKQYMTGIYPVYHWDFYRIASIEELYVSDFYDLLHEKSSVFIIEWASLFKESWHNYFPRYEISIDYGETHEQRTFTLIYKG